MAAAWRSQETSKGFSACPHNVVYSPALNCIIGTVSGNFIEVLDIHTVSLLTRVAVQDELVDNILHGMYCDDKDCFVVAKGQRIGCRGTLYEKIFLDSILQVQYKEGDKHKVKVELDVAQAGILINGLVQCQHQIESQSHHFTVKEKFNRVLTLLQKQYDCTLQKVKDLDNKAVKWLTVCLEMECNVLFAAFHAVYSIMICDQRGPALPIVGDVLRRTLLLLKNQKEDFSAKAERSYMLGEAERLETFDMWPHMNYKYALPGPMAEAGFYHPKSSKVSEDRAMCFSCSVCLVCWEPSDQPWSEHERHSSSCPFVKGEYTENVPLNVCAGTTHGAGLERENDEIVCISSQECNGLVAVATKMGYLIVWNTYPTLKKHYEVRVIEFSSQKKPEANKSSQVLVKAHCNPPVQMEPDTDPVPQEQVQGLVTENTNMFDLLPNNIGYMFPEVAVPSDVMDSPVGEIDMSPEEYTMSSQSEWTYDSLVETTETATDAIPDNTTMEEELISPSDDKSLFKTVLNKNQVEITAIVLAKLPYKTNKPSEDDQQLFSIMGLKRIGVVSKPRLLLYVHNITSSKIKSEGGDTGQQKMNKVKSSIIPEVGSTPDDPFVDLDEFYGESDDSSELSVIDEYLMVTQKQQVNLKQKSKDEASGKKCEPGLEDFVQSVELPDNLDHSISTITQLLYTEKFVIVVVHVVKEAKGSDTETIAVNHKHERSEESEVTEDVEIEPNAAINKELSAPSSQRSSDCEQDGSGTSEINSTGSSADDNVDHSSSYDEELSAEMEETAVDETSTTETPSPTDVAIDDKNEADNEQESSTTGVKEKNISCHILCYSTAKSTKGNLLSHTPVASRKFRCNEIVKDCVVVPYNKLSASTITEIQGNNASVCSRENRFLFAGITGKENCILVIEPFNLQTYHKISAPIGPDTANLMRIVFCTGLEVLAACFDSGDVWSCSLKGKIDEVCESIQQESEEEVLKLFVETELDGNKLCQLTDVTNFVPMVTGVHISVPMDWVVGKATSFSNSLFNGKKHRSHVQEICPVNGPARIKTHSLSSRMEKSGGLKSTDSSVIFKIFAAAETAIGYIDLTVKCSCPISDLTDVAVTLKLANGKYLEDAETTKSKLERGNGSDSRERYLCLPVLLSEHTGTKDTVANLVLTSPKLVSIKSSYFLVEFSQLTRVSESPFGRDGEQESETLPRPGSSEDKVSRLCISDFITGIDIAVYQFAKSELPWSPSCRKMILKNQVFHELLLTFLVKSASSGLGVTGISDRHLAMNLLMWIASILGNTEEFNSDEFRSTVRNFIPPLLRTCFIEGDRSLAHSCFEFLIIMISQSARIQDDAFLDVIAESVKQLLPNVCKSESVAAVRWFFRLTSTISSYTQFETMFTELFSLLTRASEVHRNGLTAEHMLLQSKYDISGTPMDPILAEPGEIDLAIGEASAAAIQCNSLNDNESVLKNSYGQKVFSLPSCDVPGLFEVQPLAFACCSTSDGACAEKFRTGKSKKSKCIGIPQKSSEKAEPQYDDITLPNALQSWNVFEDKEEAYYDAPQESAFDLPTTMQNTNNVQSLDMHVNQLLYFGNSNPWGQGIKVGKGKKHSQRKKENSSYQQVDEHNVRNFFTVPDPMALVIKRMHAVSHHFAVLDFQQPVMLTDILIPPCSSLASLSIVCWKGQGNEKDAFPVASSEEIGLKALVLSDIRPPIICQFLKITAVGTRTLNSAKVVIPLGQFYGYTAMATQEHTDLSDGIKNHFDDCFCQYSLATDRLLSLLNEDKHKSVDQDLAAEQVLKAYEDCSIAQFQLNAVVYHRRRIGGLCADLTQLDGAINASSGENQSSLSVSEPDIVQDFSKVHQDFLRVIIECCLETLLLLIIDSDPFKGQPLDKGSCCDLFKSICIYGSTKTRQQGCLLLQCLCGGLDWWGEFLVSSFKYCYGDENTAPMPMERLFPCFVRLIQNSQNLTTVYEAFLELLSSCLQPLLTQRGNTGLRNASKSYLLDWILLLLNELLQEAGPSSSDWTFLTPWDIIAQERGSLEDRMYEGIKNYLHQRQQHKKKPSSNGSFAQQKKTLPPKKKYSTIHVVQDPQNVSNKLLKDLLQLRTHPALTRKGKAPQLTENVKRSVKQPRSCPVILSEAIVVPVVEKLFALLSRSNIIEHTECAILTCKVASGLCSTCQNPVTAIHSLMSEELRALLKILLSRELNPWVALSLTCQLKDFVTMEIGSQADPFNGQADDLTSQATATPSSVSPTETPSGDTLSKDGKSGEEPGDSKTDLEFLEGLEGAASGIASSLASNLMKLIKERAPNTSGKPENKEPKTVKITSNLLTTSYLSNPILDDFHKVFVTACQRRILRDNKDIYVVLQEGLPSKQPCQYEVNRWDGVDKLGKVVTVQDTSAFFNRTVSDIVSLGHSKINCLELIIVLLDHAFSKKAVLSSSNILAFQSWLREIEVKTFCQKDFNNVALSAALQLFADFTYKSNSSSKKDANVLKNYSNLYLKMYQVSSAEKQRTPVLLKSPVTLGEHDLLSLVLKGMKEDSGVFLEEKRIMLKELLLCSLEAKSFNQDQSGLKSFLQLLMDCKIPIHSFGEQEKKLTLSILVEVSDCLKDFMSRNSDFLNMSWSYFSDKQVVFLLNKGLTLSAGKFGEDTRIKYCHLLLDVLVTLMHHGIHAESPGTDDKGSVSNNEYRKIFSDIIFCLNAFKRRHLTESRDGVSQLLLQFPQSSKRFPLGIHSIGERLFDFLYLLRGCSSCKEYMLEAFVDCIKEQLNGGSEHQPSVVVSDPLKHIVLSMLDDKTIQSFIEMDGLSLIQQCIRHQRCSVQLQVSSSVIRGMLLRNQDRSLGILADKVDSRKKLNGYEVENFAPCAKITGPPQCTPAEILLQSKSRHQRLRFAAWSYQYQEVDNSWISLTIEVPFVILLHEMVVKMHPSFLGGCPSETIVEIAGVGSKLLPHSPSLPTSGLSVIYLEFAKGTLAKVVRLRFRRPMDSDSIRLNLIELYGVAALTTDGDTNSSINDSELSPGVEILQHMLMESPSSFENLKSSQEQAMLLAKSLISVLDRSTNSSSQRMICNIIGKILSSMGERVFEMVEFILSENGDHLSSTQVENDVECRVLYQVYRYTTGDVRIKFLHHLLGWIQDLLKQLKGSKRQVNIHRVSKSLNIVAALIFLLMSEEKAVELSCPKGLVRCLLDESHGAFSQPNLFQSLAAMACALISACPDQFYVLSSHCSELMAKDLSLSHPSIISDVFFILLSCMSSTTGDLLLNTPLIEKVLLELQEALSSTVEDHKAILEVLKVLRIVDLCARLPHFVQQYGFKERTQLWRDLILFVCSKCSFSGYDQSGRSLRDLHAIQASALGLLKKLLTGDEDQRRHFVLLLLDVISSKDVFVNHVLSSSFMKCVMLQLIIQEEEVTVVIGKNSGRYLSDLNVGFCPETVSDSINYLDHKLYMKMKLSERLAFITKSLLSTKSKEPAKKEENSPPAKGPENSTQQLDGYMDMNADGIALMFSSAKSAMDKRTVKGDDKNAQVNDSETVSGIALQVYCPSVGGSSLPPEFTIGQTLQKLAESGQAFYRGQALKITYEPVQIKNVDTATTSQVAASKDQKEEAKSLPTMLHTFANEGGLAVLARQMTKCLDIIGGDLPSNSISIILKLLPLSGFANILLQERKKAEYLLRLMLGVEENSEGDPISASAFASELHLLPFVSLKHLLDAVSLSTEEGRAVRNEAFQQGVVTMILDQLALLSHCEKVTNGKERHSKKSRTGSDGGPSYWAKGTGFGTGSTASTWDVEKAIQEKKREEDHIICLLQVLTSYLSSGQDLYTTEWCEDKDSSLPNGLSDVLLKSTLIPLLSGYLRNDSVLDMANHIPLYHTVMEIMRALASFKFLHFLLLLDNVTDDGGKTETAHQLLMKLNSCADTYMERLRAMKTSKKGERKIKSATKMLKEQKRKETSVPTEPESEELSILIKDIMDTASLVKKRGEEFKSLDVLAKAMIKADKGDCEDGGEENSSTSETMSMEDRYVAEIMKLQFDTYEIVGDGDDEKVVFNVPYHFASSVRAAISSGAGSSMRSRRLAQEVASLSTSLPISYGSCVIMRCDDSRLDVMKVLITGPEDTPYANGCFEFDIFFPTDYPASPVMVNLQTTGQHSVRFNPNLYNDGKVCLSILNTWHGRPEEKWNSTTSNLLQVLVSIQSLILVPEPYFNEPGYERMRNTPFGQQNSFSYNANIRQAVVRWGMIEQLRKPSPCFTEVIQRHFLMKKDVILRQCEQWLCEMKEQSTVKKSNAVHYEALKNHYWTLKSELEKLEQGKLQVDIPSTSKENSPASQNVSVVSDYDSDVYADLEMGGPVAYL